MFVRRSYVQTQQLLSHPFLTGCFATHPALTRLFTEHFVYSALATRARGGKVPG
jgi:hypothetical protein